MYISDEKINKILYWIIKIGVFIILFVPLVVGSKFYFPFIVLKNVLFRIIVEVILFAYIILAYREPKYRPKLNSLTLNIFIFFAIVTISSLFGIGLYRSFWGNYERMGGLFLMWHILAYFVVLTGVFQERKEWMQFFSFSIFASTLMAIFSFAQKLDVPFILQSSGGSRLTGTIGNASYLAAYLLINLFFIMYFLFRHKEFSITLFAASVFSADMFLVLHDILNTFNSETSIRFMRQLWSHKPFFLFIVVFQTLVFITYFLRKQVFSRRIFLLLLFFFQFLIFLWTQTRGAVLGFSVGIFTMFIFGTIFTKGKKLKVIFALALFSTMALPFIIYFAKNTSFVRNEPTLQRLVTISYSNITTQSRLLTWKASWDGWINDPIRFIFGSGDENYYFIFNKGFPQEIYRDSGSQIWFDRAHNIIFDTGINFGIFGLVAYLSIFALAFWFLYRLFKARGDFALSAIFLALLLAYFGQNFFVFDTLNTYILFYLVLGFIVFLYNELEHKEYVWFQKASVALKQAVPQKRLGHAMIGVIIAFALLIGWSIYWYNIRHLQVNNYLFKGLSTSQGLRRYKEADQWYQKAIEGSSTGGRYEARQQYLKFSSELLRSKEIDKESVMPIVRKAIQEMRKSIDEEPKNVFHYLLLANFYNRTTFMDPKNPDRAIALLQKAAQLSPTRPQIYFELSQANFIKNDFEDAFRYMEKGLSLSPKVFETHLDAAKIYIMAGWYDKAEEMLKYIESTIGAFRQEDFGVIIQAYEAQNAHDRLARLYEKLVERFPQNVNFWSGLANTYAKTGEDEKAKEAIAKALALDSSREQEAQKFLEALQKKEE